MEHQIKESLIQLLDSIKRADGAGIANQLGQLDDLLAQGRGQLHPQLVHYLEGRSYAKAVAWLGGEGGIPRGSCQFKGEGKNLS
ncbi:MAG TPA: hypothetical protein PLN52_05260 [Opitutaceae bacterium]|nr:hypothetical protein [Opitutaceae bacterium]